MRVSNRMNTLTALSCFFLVIQTGWVLADDPSSSTGENTTEQPTEVEWHPRQPKGNSGWSIFLGVGHRKGIHTAEDFKAGLVDGGYVDGNWSGGFWIPSTYSASPSGGSKSSAFHVGLSYDPNPKLGYRLILNSGEIVHASGQLRDEDRNSYQIGINGSLTTVGLLVEYRPSPVIRLGAGPTYNLFAVDYVSYINSEPALRETQSHGVLGLALEAMLTAPARTSWFIFFGLQRHEVMNFDIGPFENMPTTSASVSHSIWLLGLGIRP